MDVVFQLETDPFQKVTEEILKNLHNSSQGSGPIENHIIDSAKDYVRKLIIKHNFDLDNVSENIQNNEWDQEKLEYFVTLLKKRRNEIFHSIITHHNRTYADTLVGFDWFLKIVLGSSESKGLRYPLLQVLLSSVNTSGDQKQRLYEFNKESVCKLIQILENYQQGIDNNN